MSELYTYEDLHELDEIFGDLDMTMLHSGEKHRVFVYGTLMSGMRNHYRLVDAGAKLITDSAITTGDLKMLARITSSGYRAPIVITGVGGEPRGVISGEVYEVDNKTLMLLDQLEGHPDVYERQKVMISYYPKAQSSWMYVYVAEIPDDYDVELISTTGDPKTGFVLHRWKGE